MSPPKCTSWRGHKFVGRYSNPGIGDFNFHSLGVNRISEYTFLEMAELKKGTIYERDVCVRCGATIEKAQP